MEKAFDAAKEEPDPGTGGFLMMMDFPTAQSPNERGHVVPQNIGAGWRRKEGLPRAQPGRVELDGRNGGYGRETGAHDGDTKSFQGVSVKRGERGAWRWLAGMETGP